MATLCLGDAEIGELDVWFAEPPLGRDPLFWQTRSSERVVDFSTHF